MIIRLFVVLIFTLVYFLVWPVHFIINSIKKIMKTFETAYNDLQDIIYDDPCKENDIFEDYERDEDGNLLSACCGEILDEDVMICMVCKEHC